VEKRLLAALIEPFKNASVKDKAEAAY